MMPEELSSYKKNMQAGGEFRKAWEHKEVGSWYSPNTTKAKVMGGLLLFLTAMVGLKNCHRLYQNDAEKAENSSILGNTTGLELVLEEKTFDESDRLVFAEKHFDDGKHIMMDRKYNANGGYTETVQEYQSSLLVKTTETSYNANGQPLQK